MAEKQTLTHVFIDHSNLWGSVRLASRIRHPGKPDASARVSVRKLDRVINGRRQGTSTKIASGGIPPGMEGLWEEYRQNGYDTQRLFRDANWKEHGVDHSIIGHMWRLMARYREAPTTLLLVSGDGRRNEFKTSFLEVVDEVLTKETYKTWRVELASFHWEYPKDAPYRSPTSTKLLRRAQQSPRGSFVNLMDHYQEIVFHEK